MRNLIRLTLFLLARMGLFFAVMAWIVGQWLNIHAILRDRATVTLESNGFVVAVFPQTALAPFSEILTSRWDNESEFLEEIESRPKTIVFAGCSYYNDFTRREMTIGVRHWLIVTIFALFHGVLMWVYRKQGKVTADAR